MSNTNTKSIKKPVRSHAQLEVGTRARVSVPVARATSKRKPRSDVMGAVYVLDYSPARIASLREGKAVI